MVAAYVAPVRAKPSGIQVGNPGVSWIQSFITVRSPNGIVLNPAELPLEPTENSGPVGTRWTPGGTVTANASADGAAPPA